MSQTIEDKNKALVLEAFDTLFNKRDYVVDEFFYLIRRDPRRFFVDAL